MCILRNNETVGDEPQKSIEEILARHDIPMDDFVAVTGYQPIKECDNDEESY